MSTPPPSSGCGTARPPPTWWSCAASAWAAAGLARQKWPEAVYAGGRVPADALGQGPEVRAPPAAARRCSGRAHRVGERPFHRRGEGVTPSGPAESVELADPPRVGTTATVRVAPGDAGRPRRAPAGPPPASVSLPGPRASEGPQRARARWPTTPSWPGPSTPSTATSCSPPPCRPASVSSSSCGWLPCGSPTTSGDQHAVLAGDAGITAEEVARIADGPEAPGWSTAGSGPDRRPVDDLMADARVADASWEVLAGDLEVAPAARRRLHRRGLRRPGHGAALVRRRPRRRSAVNEN